MKIQRALATVIAGLAAGWVFSILPTEAQSEEGAVKKVIEDFARALSARDMNLAVSYLSDDAKIDTVGAGQVSKSEWAQRQKELLFGNRNFSKVEVTGLKVSLVDLNRAVVDGDFYIYMRTSSRYRHQWILERREDKWLIVETKYR